MSPDSEQTAPQSRFKRVALIVQSTLSLALCALVPVVCFAAIYLATDGAPFAKVEQHACSVKGGRVLSPLVADEPTTSVARDNRDECTARLNNALYHGEHQINCYVSAQSKKSVAAPIEIAYMALQGLLATALLGFVWPCAMQSCRTAYRGAPMNKRSALLDPKVKRILLFLPPLALLLPTILQTAKGDLESYCSEDWKESACRLIEICEHPDAQQKISAGFVFELEQNGKRYRSNSSSGTSASSTIPAELENARIGDQIVCFQNPDHPAQLKLEPSHPPRWQTYLHTFLVSAIAFCAFWALWRWSVRG